MITGTQITVEIADELIEQGIACWFDLESSKCAGYFESKPHCTVNNEILIITDEGYFLRAREDLVKSQDGVFVGFCEQGIPPEFDDVFQS